MKAVIDIECDKLVNPEKIWLVVAKDLTTEKIHVFKDVQGKGRDDFLVFWRTVRTYIGHNWLEYDYPTIRRLLGADFELQSVSDVSVDTLVLSRLADYSRQNLVADVPAGVAKLRHSVAAYGEQFGFPKIAYNDFSQYSPEMETYCVRDVLITEKIYNFHKAYADKYWTALRMEQRFQYEVVNALHDNGFAFNKTKAEKLLEKVIKELEELDLVIRQSFPPKLSIIREITPRLTKYGTLHKGDFRWVESGDLSEFNGGPFSRCRFVAFNPGSHSQVVRVLRDAGWRPTEKTQSHIELDRSREKDLDKQKHLLEYGWKINEANLSTLPSSAPEPARSLAKRILLESRRRTLAEWLGLVQDDARIHGRFYGIGAWTHRMAHQQPNTANIPNEFDTQGKKKLLGKELRSLWMAPKKRLLVGVDAEGIQLRVFAHYIDDPEFTEALVKGRKDDKTDPHSLNQRILGSVCKSRAAAKRFIYALLLGAGNWKLSQILECSETECKEALNRLLKRYEGWQRLKDISIPKDALRGYFIGLDGRKVWIPGTSQGERKHLAMSGYLQNGEAVIMKLATLKWLDWIKNETDEVPTDLKQTRIDLGIKSSLLVNLVHDEWQTETPNNMSIALRVAEYESRSLREVGEELSLRCPLQGSYYNDDVKDFTIGTNWSVTH